MTRKLTKASCYTCGAPFWAHRSDARTCGPRCKKALQRAIKRELGKATDWTARDVTGAMPWIPKNHRRDIDGRPPKGDTLKATWRDGMEVLYQHGASSPWRPALVEWTACMAEVAATYECVPLNCGFYRLCLAPHFLKRVEPILKAQPMAADPGCSTLF